MGTTLEILGAIPTLLHFALCTLFWIYSLCGH